MTASECNYPTTTNSIGDGCLPPHLVLRSFRPSSTDDAACDNLERHSDQHKNENDNIIKKILHSLIQVHKVHPQGLNAICHNICDEYEIVVCEDTSLNPPLIVAVTVANIKTCYWNKEEVKVGWVHGLRVHESYQRQGIGAAISRELEQRCLKRNVNMLYLTVNTDNSKALALYRRLGFYHASHRAPRTTPLFSKMEVSPEILTLQIPPKAAATLTAQMYKDQNMSLTAAGFEKLTRLAQYKCTIVAVPLSDLHPSIQKAIASVDETVHQKAGLELSNFVLDSFAKGKIKSIGGISLWNGSLYKRAKLMRFVFSKETWQSMTFQGGVLAMILVLLVVLCRYVHGLIWPYVIAANAEESGAWGTKSLLFLVLDIIAIMGVCRLLQQVAFFFVFLFCLDSSRLFAKAYAPFSTGPKRIACLKAAITASQNYAFDQHFGIWIMNVDINHRDGAAFGRPAFQTQFLQKWLSPPPTSAIDGGDSGGTWKEFDPSAFYDPRDSTALN